MVVSVRIWMRLENVFSHPLSDWTLPWQLINGKALRLNVCTDLLYCYGPNISGQAWSLVAITNLWANECKQRLHRLTSCLRFSLLCLGLQQSRASLFSGFRECTFLTWLISLFSESRESSLHTWSIKLFSLSWDCTLLTRLIKDVPFYLPYGATIWQFHASRIIVFMSLVHRPIQTKDLVTYTSKQQSLDSRSLWTWNIISIILLRWSAMSLSN